MKVEGENTFELLSMESPPQGQTEVTKSRSDKAPEETRGRCSPWGAGGVAVKVEGGVLVVVGVVEVSIVVG